jgi:hypothetical protein
MVCSAETRGSDNSRRLTVLSCAGRALSGFLFLALLAGGVKLSAVDSDAQNTPKMPKNMGPHPSAPEGQRARKNALTDQVSRRLPPAQRLEVTRKNYIDDYIFGKMERDHVPHARLSSDLEFLRRVYLDLTGRIPEPDAIRAFLKDTDPNKRDKLIDSLVEPTRYQFAEEDPFVDRWTYFLNDLYGNNAGDLGVEGRNIFYDYIRTCIRLNMPYDRMVRDMLTATAMTNWFSGPVNFLTRFHVDDNDNQIVHEDSCDEMAIGTGRILLGLNLECISCHAGARHLDKINLWLSQRKREELWREASFFANLSIYRPPPRHQEFTMVELPIGYDGEAYPIKVKLGYDLKADSVVRMPRWKADVSPTFLLTGEKPRPGERPEDALARMITSDPQFARATVNYLWAELMGVGIVDPPYDFDLARQDPSKPPPAPWTIQPTHPELLNALAKDLVAHGFDLRYIIKLITKSSAYQLASVFDGQWKPQYSRYFARHFVRRLSAEELFDAISQSTQVFPEIKISGTDVKVKYVMEMRSPEDLSKGELEELARFLGSFGESNRSRGVKSLQGNMVQASLLLNSKLVKERVKVKSGSRLHSLLNREPPLTNDQLVEELFLAVLSRYPTPQERQVSVAQLAKYRDAGAEDILWALMNKLDFIFNY